MIAAGFGFRRNASVESLRRALALAGGAMQPTCLATVTDKAQSAVLQTLAAELHLPVLAVSPEVLCVQITQTFSQASKKAYGTPSLAEAAALAAAGSGARLLAARRISPDRMASCAIALGDLQ